MRIVFDHVEARERARIEEALAGQQLTFLDTAITADTALPADTSILSVFVSSVVTKEQMDACPDLAHIATRSMGTDHIDMVHARERGIVVSSVPSYGTHTVAEFAFALIFALTRKVHPAHMRLRESGTVDAVASEGMDLHGKTLGVVGTGKIGKNVAKYGKAFGMDVLLFDAFPDEAFAQEISARYVPLMELAASSHVVSVHVPLLPATTHLLGTDFFGAIRQGAYIINTARGAVLDTVALRDALVNGRIAGAGLDVFEGEKEIFGADRGTHTPEGDAARALLMMPNVVMTPHIAYDSIEAKTEILETSLSNITAFMQGSPANAVS